MHLWWCLIYPWWFCNLQWLRPAGLYERCKLALELKRLKTPGLEHEVPIHPILEPRRSSWMWNVTNVKTILLKTRKPFSCRALSDGIVPIHGANVSGCLHCFRPSWTQRQEYVGNVPISPLGTPFSSVHDSTHYLHMTKLQYAISNTTI